MEEKMIACSCGKNCHETAETYFRSFNLLRQSRDQLAEILREAIADSGSDADCVDGTCWHLRAKKILQELKND